MVPMYTSVFLLNIVYFSVCLTSNKLYWIDDQLADVSTRFYTSVSWRRRVDCNSVEPSFCEICSLTGKHAQGIDISTFFVLNLLNSVCFKCLNLT